MAINTLITLRDALQAFADGHGQIQRIYFGADDKRAPMLTDAELFPALYVAPIDVVVGQAHNTHRLRIYVYERLDSGASDEWENANDTSLILRDIRVWWNAYGIDDILISEDPTGQFKTDSELDNLVGYFAEFLFEIPSHGRCDVPVSIAPIPPPTCEDASYIVEYANGDPIESGTIPSGGSETIVVPNCPPCDPSDVFINGVEIGTTTNGEPFPITVEQGGVEVGEFVDGVWVVPDCPPCADATAILVDTATPTPNTISTTPIASGASANIVAPDATANVTIDGSPFQTVNIPSGGSATIDVPSWTRPADWLPMPTVLPTDQTFVGLHAIFPSGNNFAAFRFTTNTGNYQVDWGDGTVTTYASNVVAEHTYDYATYDPTNTTLSTRGYKQAMIVVTPLTGNLTNCNFQFRRTTTPAQNQAYATGFLDCILSMPNADIGVSIQFGGTTVRHLYVERFDIKTIGNCTSLSAIFRECRSLQAVPLFNTQNVTIMSAMFSSCFSLQTVPLFNTQSVTSMSAMFSSCTSLQNVPTFNTQNVTSMASMFSSCASLQSVPLFNTANVTNMTSMFQNCSSLQTVPTFNTTSVTNQTLMFNGCNSFDRTDIICRVSVDFSNCQLSRNEIVNIFNNLLDRTAMTSANIILTGNWGATALTAGDLLIATNKNWTVTT